MEEENVDYSGMSIEEKVKHFEDTVVQSPLFTEILKTTIPEEFAKPCRSNGPGFVKFAMDNDANYSINVLPAAEPAGAIWSTRLRTSALNFTEAAAHSII